MSSATHFSVTLPWCVASLGPSFLICKTWGLRYVISKIPLRSVMIIVLTGHFNEIKQKVGIFKNPCSQGRIYTHICVFHVTLMLHKLLHSLKSS